jgi:hypothetical protein
MAGSPAKPRLRLALKHDGNRNSFTGILAIVEIVSVVIANVYVVGGIPVFGPVSRPRIHHHERITAVLEARVTINNDGLAPDAKPMPQAEIKTKGCLRDVVSAISPTLIPSTVIALPI